MTPEEINITIAEWCGWKLEIRRCHRETPAWYRNCQQRDYPPDYYYDLNAIHEAEVHGGKEVIKSMRGYLWEICDQMTAHHATAPQRCEALLRAIGKWKE